VLDIYSEGVDYDDTSLRYFLGHYGESAT